MMLGGRILVVDDEKLVRETVGSVLAEEGYVVESATDGADAIAKVVAHRPDAILLDLMMPGMNGRQFMDALRDMGHADVPVVVMTAVQGLAQGVFPPATDVIEKPFDLDDLLNKIALAVYRGASLRPEAGMRTRSKTVPPPQPQPAPEPERGVVLLVDRDRAALLRMDQMLSARGYTVVTMTRVSPELPRLARALEPCAIILDVDSGDTEQLVQSLREQASLQDVPILVFARAETISRSPDGSRNRPGARMGTVDEDLIQFVEASQRS